MTLDPLTDSSRIEEYVQSLERRRMIISFGVRPPVEDRLEMKDQDEWDRSEWECVGSLSTILARANLGSEDAKRLLAKVTIPVLPP